MPPVSSAERSVARTRAAHFLGSPCSEGVGGELRELVAEALERETPDTIRLKSVADLVPVVKAYCETPIGSLENVCPESFEKVDEVRQVGNYCFDATHIQMMLSDRYGIRGPITFTRKYRTPRGDREFDTSWTLGFVIERFRGSPRP